MKVLIAEDDSTSRKVLERMLTKWGYDTTTVTNGNDAADILLRPDSPKLILLDWVMPGKDGIEVCRIVRKIKTEIEPYIILVTSKGEKQNEVPCMWISRIFCYGRTRTPEHTGRIQNR